jgi:DNA-binding transcriptional MocR family regulator
MQPNELLAIRDQLTARYLDFQKRRLSLDMTRGKPCAEQLDLSLGLLDCLDRSDFRASDGTDCRNYGSLEGLPEARRLFAEYLEVAPDEIIIGGNSSLALMHDFIARAMLRGVPGGSAPWSRVERVKFLCPCPGYDRHFSICQYFGIEMITVEMNEDGPDMDAIERHVAADPSIKGIWCVPKYSNPTGITYADEVVIRLAEMKTAAPDFRIFWDNAYAVHHLSGEPAHLRNILAACQRAGNPERPILFGSTSKISFAGAGLALVAGSTASMQHVKEGLAIQTIGFDKLNQLRHVRFFKNMAGILDHMKKHAAILKPKFDAVHEILERELAGRGLAAWTRPEGGYFISLDTLDGCAKAVVAMAAEAGVKLTAAGATFPKGNDPRDQNIRIAPTMPPLEEICQAMELLAICIQRVSIDKALRERSAS